MLHFGSLISHFFRFSISISDLWFFLLVDLMRRGKFQNDVDENLKYKKCDVDSSFLIEWFAVYKAILIMLLGWKNFFFVHVLLCFIVCFAEKPWRRPHIGLHDFLWEYRTELNINYRWMNVLNLEMGIALVLQFRTDCCPIRCVFGRKCFTIEIFALENLWNAPLLSYPIMWWKFHANYLNFII